MTLMRINVDYVLRAIRGTAALIDHEERCAGCHPSGQAGSFSIRRAKVGDVYAYLWVDTTRELIPHWRVTGQPVFQRWPVDDFFRLRNAMSGESYAGIYRGSILRYAPIGSRPIFRNLDEVRAARTKETA